MPSKPVKATVPVTESAKPPLADTGNASKPATVIEEKDPWEGTTRARSYIEDREKAYADFEARGYAWNMAWINAMSEGRSSSPDK